MYVNIHICRCVTGSIDRTLNLIWYPTGESGGSDGAAPCLLAQPSAARLPPPLTRRTRLHHRQGGRGY